jgi:hypothetical protein
MAASVRPWKLLSTSRHYRTNVEVPSIVAAKKRCVGEMLAVPRYLDVLDEAVTPAMRSLVQRFRLPIGVARCGARHGSRGSRRIKPSGGLYANRFAGRVMQKGWGAVGAVSGRDDGRIGHTGTLVKENGRVE